VNRNYAPRDLKMDVNLDVSHDLRRNDRLGDHYLDDDHHGVLVCHRTNVTGDRNDLNLDVSRVNRNYVLRDQNLDVNLVVSRDHRMNAMDDRNDLKMDGTMDASRDHRRSDLLVGQNLGANRGHCMSDRLDDLRMNAMDDRKMDGNHVNRNYAPHDLKMVANLDGMNLLLMYY
jgi:hypothetical protein